jgi:guanylate kinase
MSDAARPIVTRRSGILFVLSAPSGAGKTTVAEAALARLDGFVRSVSTTTRPPRPGEIDGVDYRFVDRTTFARMVNEGAFIEWAEVHDNLYGTAWANVKQVVAEQRADLLLVIDVQGARSIREKDPEAVTIFLLPPSTAELERRLTGRGDESVEAVALRLANAADEIAEAPSFDYVVVNDNLETAVAQFVAVVAAERSRAARLDIDDLSPHSER